MKLMNTEEWTSIWNSKIIKVLDFPWRFLMWRNYLKLLKQINIGSECKVLELGSGMGINSFKLKKKFKCDVTLVDSCCSVLEKSKEFFRNRNMKANIIKSDALSVKSKEKYDVVFSEGLLEHFSGKERKDIFKKHVELAKPNGYIIVFVPRDSRIYWFIRKILNKIGLWYYNEEPFSEEEVLNLSKDSKINVISVLKPFFGLWIAILAQKA